jgi:hypothetical protein
MRSEISGKAVVRGMVMVGTLVLGLAVRPQALSAQQSASVLVRVNVIRTPIAAAAFDSLTQTVRRSASNVTMAKAEARAAERGVRVRRVEAPKIRTAEAPEPEVVHMEYVAN